MTIEAHKEKVRRWFTDGVRGGIDRQRFEAIARETFAPDVADHDGPDPEHGFDAILRAVPALMQAFPDCRFTVEQMIGEGDRVAVRLRGEATHGGEAMGVAPTGQRIAWAENEIFRFEDGRIVESWGEGTLDDALAAVGLGFRRGPT